MPNKQWTRNTLLSGVIAIMILCAFAPSARGYGLAFSTAETIGAGIKTDTLVEGSNNWVTVYYKVSCSMGSTLKVILTYTSGEWIHFNMKLYDPNESLLTSDESTPSATVQTVCRSSGDYYIMLDPYGGGVTSTYSLNVQLTTIPGFDPWLVLFSAVVAIGIIAFIMRRKYQKV